MKLTWLDWIQFIERPEIAEKFMDNYDKFGLEFAQGYRKAQWELSHENHSSHS